MAFENTLAAISTYEKEANNGVINQDHLLYVIQNLILDIQTESGADVTALQDQIDALELRVTTLEGFHP